MPEPTHAMNPADRELEDALRTLTPSEPRIDRDALMFRLGRESVRPSCARWRFAAAAMLLFAVGSLTLHVSAPSAPMTTIAPDRMAEYQNAIEIAPPMMNQPYTPPTARLIGISTRPTPVNDYLHMRNMVLTYGVDVLPEPVARGGGLPSDDLDELIERPAAQALPPFWRQLHRIMQNGDNS